MLKDKLLVFDLDGTLIDSAIDIHHALIYILDKYKKPLVEFEQTKRHIGEGLRGLMESIFHEELHLNENLPDELMEDFRAHYTHICNDNTYAYPGVHDFLKNCDATIAVLSNKPERFVHQTMEGSGLKEFPWIGIFGGDSFEKSKPNPVGLNFLMDKANIAPENTVMIGDGLPDVEVAINAGTKLVVSEFGFMELDRLKQAGATTSFSAYSQLHEKLNEVFQS